LKRSDLYKNIPIILITAQTQAKDLEALKGSPAEFYLIKPFDLEELKKKIEQLLQ
jgi:CheY-like chemotaxis protein